MNPQDYIPKPCHENWDKMSGDKRQKFCDKCSCSVHNLTGKSHQEIMNLRDELGGKLCGVFNTNINATPKKKVRKIDLTRPLILGASISSLALGLAACQQEEHMHSTTIGEGAEPPKSQTTPSTQPIKIPDAPSRLLGEVYPPEFINPPKLEPVKIQPILGKVRQPDPVNPPDRPKRLEILGRIAVPRKIHKSQ